MKISFDAQLLFEEQKTGIGWMTKQVIDHMIEQEQNQYQINCFTTRKNQDIQRQILEEYKKKGCFVKKHSWLSGFLYRRISKVFPIPYSWLFGNDSDITQFFNYSVPFGVKGKKCTILHDMSYKAYPQTVSKQTRKWLNKNLPTYCKRADCILTDSHFSREEIKKYLNIQEEKLHVVYCGVEHEKYNKNLDLKKLEDIKKKYNIEKPYFLYLGTLEPRKNIPFIIDAFYEIAQFDQEVILVISGKKGWLYNEIFSKVREYQLQNRVIFTGYIEEEEVPYLFYGAIAFVFPSLYEGFGLPVLEAMACGTPTIISNQASLPEVGGEAVCYVDIGEDSSIKKMSYFMRTFMEDKELYKKKSLLGEEQAKKFTWRKTAQEFLEIYRTLIVEDKK